MANSAWRRQRQLKQKYALDEVPSIDELDQMLERVVYGKQNQVLQTLQARALFALYYLTGCRLSEILRTPKLRKQKLDKKTGVLYHWKDDHDYLGIRKNQIDTGLEGGRLCLYIRTENRKNKNRGSKKQPIPMEFEEPLVKHLLRYNKKLSKNALLFNFSARRAEQIIAEAFNYNIHFIRHIRATHLVSLYDFNEQMLIRFMGWTDGRPAKFYMELRTQDLFNAFYKNRG